MPTHKTSPFSSSPRHEAARQVAFAAVQSAVERYRKKLLKYPNVIDVRPGYKFRSGWITHEPAVVVTVLRKLPEDQLQPGEILPKVLDGIPVDVAPASPVEQLRAQRPKAAARAAAPALPEEAPYILPGTPPAPPAEAEERGARVGAGHGYRKPDGLSLKAVKGAMAVTCHASPDAGWPNLQKFLQGVRHTLTVAMYDFTAVHIYDAVKAAMAAADDEMRLSIDYAPHGAPRQGEMTKPAVVEGLQKALGQRFEYAKAAVGILYPNAYHIKVAVRDGQAFWLSSDNWQNSNQPPEDAAKLDPAGQRKLFSGHNREWHLIIEHPALAKLYEAYIKWDMSEDQRVEAPGARDVLPAAPELPDLLIPAEGVGEAERAVVRPVVVFKPLKLTFTAQAPVKVQPLLTPDNYSDNVLSLIQSAKERLYIQNQYIKPQTNSPEQFRQLCAAVARKAADGVDVRIILRREGGSADIRKMIESIETVGVPTDADHLRLLDGCHNKGIVVDSQTVMVGSHNWSGDGTVFNRDASMILFDPKAAAYFEKIFLHDWDNRASATLPSERGAMPMIAPPGSPRDAVPPGMRRVSWQEYFGD
jgi:hypothetical protein